MASNIGCNETELISEINQYAEEFGAHNILDGLKDDLKGIAKCARYACQAIKTRSIPKRKADIPVNPYFEKCLDMTSLSTESPLCSKYMLHRMGKQFGAAVGISAGAAVGASGATAGINVFSSSRHGNAVASTTVHAVHLKSLARKYSSDPQATQWLDVCLKAKDTKGGMRTGQLALSFVPGVSLAQDAVVSAGVSALQAAGTYIGKHYLISSEAGAVNRAALDIHWHAYRELDGDPMAKRAKGPASAIYFEIFTRRSLTRFLGGQYDIAGLIAEPGGWIPLRDKLRLI